MTFEEYKELRRERIALHKAIKRERAKYRAARRNTDKIMVRLREINKAIAG